VSRDQPDYTALETVPLTYPRNTLLIQQLEAPPPAQRQEVVQLTRQPGASQSAQRPEPVSLNHKRKPRDYAACSDTEDSPIPPSQAPPHKKGRFLHEPELLADLSEDDEDQIAGGGEGGGKQRKWTEDEVKKFVYALMGPDGSWNQYMKSPTRTLKKVSIQVDSNITAL